MNTINLAISLLIALAYGPAQGLAVPLLVPDLASFAVLGAAGGVTNVPTSTIGGNLDSAPNYSAGGGMFSHRDRYNKIHYSRKTLRLSSTLRSSL